MSVWEDNIEAEMEERRQRRIGVPDDSRIPAPPPLPPHLREERIIADAIKSARIVQEFLWGHANGDWGLEEWKRMLRKRIAKLDEVQKDNPHAAVEIRKRLLQTAALSIALMRIIDESGVPWEASENAPPSNLPQYASVPAEALVRERTLGDAIEKARGGPAPTVMQRGFA